MALAKALSSYPMPTPPGPEGGEGDEPSAVTGAEDPPAGKENARCANCDAPMYGPFCAQCGQHTRDLHRSVRRLVGEFLDNTFCWDNKFVLTLRPLIRQPGLLTREYLEGHRVRYVQPLRLFLFTSAICLTLLQVFHGGMFHVNVGVKRSKKAVGQAETGQVTPTPTPAASAATPKSSEDAEEAKEAPGADADFVSSAQTQAEQEHTRRVRALQERIASAVDEKINHTDPVVFTRDLNAAIQRRLSWVALALLPIFALILQAVYWRREHYYFAHLIFSLHYHTFLLLFWTVLAGWDAIVDHARFLHWIDPLNVLWMVVPGGYLYLALRRVYGGKPGRTALRVGVIGVLHLLALAIGVVAAGAPAFFMGR